MILLVLLTGLREQENDPRLQILDTLPDQAYHRVAEVVTVSEADRLAALQRAGLVHPRAEAVTAPLFSSGGFFLAADKVQVKYEMLRAHLAEHLPVTAAPAPARWCGGAAPPRTARLPARPALLPRSAGPSG